MTHYLRAFLYNPISIRDDYFSIEKRENRNQRSTQENGKYLEKNEKAQLKNEHFDNFLDSFVWIEESKYDPLSESEWQQILDKSSTPVERSRIFASLQEGVPRKL